MGKISLCLAGGLLVVVRYDDKLNLALLEVLMPLFELTELDHADRSPPAAKEHKTGALSALEILIREGAAVRQGRCEVRQLAAGLRGTGVNRRPGCRHQHVPLARAQQGEHHQSDTS